MNSFTHTAARTARGASTLPPRVVLVTRPTEFELLIRRHGTVQQAAFFLRTREQDLEPVRLRHERFLTARAALLAALPSHWRRTSVARADLDRFLFEPQDLVVAFGQDGLVANLAKYLDGQPVVGLNPDPERYEGVLVRHAPAEAMALLQATVAGEIEPQARAMAMAKLDDGRELFALNELFIGHRSHQSARYHIAFGSQREDHSSSGLIVSTGTGATGWAKSVALSRQSCLALPQPTDQRLVFFVREAWPSVATGTACVEGLIEPQRDLVITSRMDEGGVIFGDGIEVDRVEFGWGCRARISVASRHLYLV